MKTEESGSVDANRVRIDAGEVASARSHAERREDRSFGQVLESRAPSPPAGIATPVDVTTATKKLLDSLWHDLAAHDDTFTTDWFAGHKDDVLREAQKRAVEDAAEALRLLHRQRSEIPPVALEEAMRQEAERELDRRHRIEAAISEELKQREAQP